MSAVCKNTRPGNPAYVSMTAEDPLFIGSITRKVFRANMNAIAGTWFSQERT